MCDWDEFLFACNHSVFRLKWHCHSARNDPNHRCYRVQVLRNSWRQARLCDDCIAQTRAQAQNAAGQ
ncbi:UDP-glucose 6-dehydrogenase [Purpureocillium lavendulum]|uniref:UDP-glucose 6-dehydrogenase n=1 Tax=Purpureocillium lavendulum TaxID=1247861 RepID=A0AB34FVV2_9HYPO|nr:UDP-glucose 6-dehydrogenase [Purpureocillium lavendulum]